jgi:hypothetical protein
MLSITRKYHISTGLIACFVTPVEIHNLADYWITEKRYVTSLKYFFLCGLNSFDAIFV